MPNLDPWLNQNQSENDQQQEGIISGTTAKAVEESTKLENYLLYVRTHNQKQIKPNCHPTYNEDHEKRIEIIDWVLKKYKDGLLSRNNQQQNNEEQIVDNIIEELDSKRDIAINKKKNAELKDEMLKYRLEEDTLDYVLFVIRDFTGRYYN
ncbi:MAG TPA: hypothetical protein VE595_02805 [Nitrososphaeraceae archaeon]|jgi:hypothetical protein|nr:hypothetical protein [Nitrososphaeraceae archaeon]